VVLGFDDQATALGVTAVLAQQYQVASEHLAAAAVRDVDGLTGCDPAKVGHDACARSFVASFGARAFRRPLEPAQEARLFSLYAWGASRYSYATGIELVIQAALQSPYFLYRVEHGMPDPGSPSAVKLDGYDVASRLSYMLWGSMPDEALFATAKAGRLDSAEGVAAEARRMLGDPRARAAVAHFNEQWLGLQALDGLTRDSAVYPAFDPTWPALWKQETLEFLGHVVFDLGGTVQDMLTANWTMMNGAVAASYGLTSGPKGDAFEVVPLDPARRAGFLTQASVLASYAEPNQTSPVARGLFVREQLLCQMLPPPPASMPIVPPVVNPKATTRQMFVEHAANPLCNQCHQLMDPIGFGFEHYDADGVWRDTDHGLPVDATGQIINSTDVDGPFNGVIDLAIRLGASEEVRDCVATQWFRYGYGRSETAEDACAVGQIQRAFKAAGYSVEELLVALTQTDAFRYRKAE
jgi:Protein of unknown function (DUF1592)/Protein of unknown function (DUF1588)/Protein of unknown function (DUF1595)/Protein of unknown function (DUF1585)